MYDPLQRRETSHEQRSYDAKGKAHVVEQPPASIGHRKPSTHSLVNGQDSNELVMRQTTPMPISNAGCFGGDSVFQTMIRPSPSLHGFMPDNVYGAMQAGTSNPMYGNMSVQPGFQCAAGRYRMPGANMRMAGFSQPYAQDMNMTGVYSSSSFDPKDWIAACHPSKVACDIEKVEVLHGKSSKDIEGGHPFVICNKRHRWIQRKTVADAIEALIGAYLEDGDEYAALAFMTFVGMDVVVNTVQIEKVQSLSKHNLSLLKKIDIKAIESLLSYSFEHKGLLIEAFTHASFSNHLGKCYQRLEFLGDSVLDFLITQHLYREHKNSQPGELTDLRSTIVSNKSFAIIVIERGLYSHLIENSVELSRCIKEFITSQSGRAGDWEGVKCPKVKHWDGIVTPLV
ncbi:hypothetical protein L7F22_040947 [Adiantum nelumboides]|nr:hypothetical protein [Adiantum nelumboides]